MRILKSRPMNDLTAPRTPNHGRCGGAWEPGRCPLQGPQRPRRLDDSGRPRGPGRPLSEAVGEARCGDLVIRSPGLSRWRCRGCGSGRFSNGGEIINKVVFLLSSGTSGFRHALHTARRPPWPHPAEVCNGIWGEKVEKTVSEGGGV